MAAHPYFNPANAVTAARYLTLPPFFWAVDAGYRDVALLVALGCGILDKLDGLVAKAFDCKTTFGSVFDAVTDGVCYSFMLLVLVAFGWAPWIPVAIVLGLGVVNMVFRALYSRRVGETVNYRSFAMERVVAYVAYLIGFACADYEVLFFYWGCAAIITIVVVHDAKRMLIDPVPARQTA